MKKLISLLVLAVVSAAGYIMYPVFGRGLFGLSGTVSISPRLSRYAAQPNEVCYVILKNAGGMPVAVKRYVNPDFPLHFSVKPSDFIMADAWKDTLSVEVQINSHGKIGKLETGDMFGSYGKPIALRSDKVAVTVDKMLGMPTLIASARDEKFRYIFRSSAR